MPERGKSMNKLKPGSVSTILLAKHAATLILLNVLFSILGFDSKFNLQVFSPGVLLWQNTWATSVKFANMSPNNLWVIYIFNLIVKVLKHACFYKNVFPSSQCSFGNGFLPMAC